ncbi:MAG: hypothetical protein EHM72_18265 [Calditrichaeota bacterium]|nr:MAG: hypothetical protein EHM72_18265 [Calditrichota bacterium]
MKSHLITLFLLMGLSMTAFAEQTLLDDIQFSDKGDTLIFANQYLTLKFDRQRGNWLELRYGNDNHLTDGRDAAVRALIDESAIPAGTNHLLHYSLMPSPGNDSIDLILDYDLKDYPQLKMQSIYRLYPGKARLLRMASLTNRTDERIKLWGFKFDLPRVALGDPEKNTVDSPGPWFPTSYIGTQRPYLDLIDKTLYFHSAPETGFGLLRLSNDTQKLSLVAWMETDGQVNYQPSIRGEEQRLTLSFSNYRGYWLLPNMTISSDPMIIEWIKGTPFEALQPYREMVCDRLPLGPASEWVRDAVILEVYPRYFKDGFRGITRRLSFYKEIGFNCLYLMPHWSGGYSPINLFQVNPEYGSQEELQELVRSAHTLGMRVLFDMVIHGMNENSPLMKESPELFCKDIKGEIVRHPTWRSMTFDWANPEYQDYMVSLVQHDVDRYDIDGYRVDAAAFKGPNWDPTLPYPAFRSGAAAPELMSKMLAALQATKPEAVLLSEVFGPLFHHVCNFVHDNQTEAAQMMIEMIEAGSATADTYKAHMADVFDMLPTGANRVFFTRNHDTSWFYHFYGYSRLFLVFEAIHALCAIPEVFGGDPEHAPNPDDDPDIFEFYRRLFALRNQFKPLINAPPLFRSVACSNPMVFSALKGRDGHYLVILVSMSDRQQVATLQFDQSLGAINPNIRFTSLDHSDVLMKNFSINLEPFAVLISEIPSHKE